MSVVWEQIRASSSVVLRVLLVMTLSAVVLVVVEFGMELLDRLALLDLIVQAHGSLGNSELLLPLLQDSLVLSVPTRNAHRAEFLESALDCFRVFS
jgi:hypothetical protein